MKCSEHLINFKYLNKYFILIDYQIVPLGYFTLIFYLN